MAKYTFEFKKKIVEEYMAGKGGYAFLAKKYNISSDKNIKTWVANYKNLGIDGLKRSRKNKEYTFNFKLNVVNLYLTSEVSYQELSIMYKINNPSLVTRWVNDYRNVGPDALKPQKRGRKNKMKKPKETIDDKTKTTD